MRVLFTVSNWPGHWYSMVPLGWALQAAGHEVKVLCAPSQTEPLTHAGLVPLPVLGAMDMSMRGRLHNYRKALAGTWPFDTLPPHPLTGEPLAGPLTGVCGGLAGRCGSGVPVVRVHDGLWPSELAVVWPVAAVRGGCPPAPSAPPGGSACRPRPPPSPRRRTHEHEGDEEPPCASW